jgi:UDP-N-acetylmuramate--alanine ligase
MQEGLAAFQGIGRRFEILGELPLQMGAALLVDDYAHHPREIAATLAAARGCWPGQRLVAVFQPHRYTRTRDLFDDFSSLLSQIDCLLVSEVYPAGEEPIRTADGRALCRSIRTRGGVDPVFVADLRDLWSVLEPLLRADDVVLTLGAGDIGRFARELVGVRGIAREGTNG